MKLTDCRTQVRLRVIHIDDTEFEILIFSLANPNSA